MEIEVAGNSGIPHVNPLMLSDTEINIVLFQSNFYK